ncbi:MAG: hypothetical protein ACLU3I_01640 [Acutalibacteraceae bacterium]
MEEAKADEILTFIAIRGTNGEVLVRAGAVPRQKRGLRPRVWTSFRSVTKLLWRRSACRKRISPST